MRGPLRREVYGWGILWDGTAEQLAAAGVIAAEQVQALAPIGRGRRRPPIVLPSGHSATIRQSTNRRGYWVIAQEYTEAEKEAYYAQRRQQNAAAEQAQRYGTPARARATAEGTLREGMAAIAMAFNLIQHKDVPHSFDADTRAAVIESLRDLRALFDCGRLAVPVAPRPVDAQFETFMRAMVPR